MPLSVENVQVWIWNIYFIGTHTWWGDSASMEHFKYLMLKGSHSRSGCYTRNKEGVNVLKYIMCIGFPKFSVYVVFVNNMLFISMNISVNMLNLGTTKIMCWGE